MGLAPLVELAPEIDLPFLGHYGDEDRGIPVSQVEALRAALGTAAAPAGGRGCRSRDLHDVPMDRAVTHHTLGLLRAWGRSAPIGSPCRGGCRRRWVRTSVRCPLRFPPGPAVPARGLAGRR